VGECSECKCWPAEHSPQVRVARLLTLPVAYGSKLVRPQEHPPQASCVRMHSPSCTDCYLRLLVNRKNAHDGLRVFSVSVPLYVTAQQASLDIACGRTVVRRMYKTCCSETNITHALELAMSCRVVSCRAGVPQAQGSGRRRGQTQHTPRVDQTSLRQGRARGGPRACRRTHHRATCSRFSSRR
jgi:hypothetical protein